MIKIDNVTKIFGKDFKAVDSLDLEIHEGKIYGFLGPNGAGKITTLKMLTGVLSPDVGNIKINGYDIIKNFPNINIENIDVLLDSILEWAVLNPKKNNKKELLLVATKLINSKRGFYLD